MSVSNYNATDIRNDLTAMKAREEREQARPQLQPHILAATLVLIKEACDNMQFANMGGEKLMGCAAKVPLTRCLAADPTDALEKFRRGGQPCRRQARSVRKGLRRSVARKGLFAMGSPWTLR